MRHKKKNIDKRFEEEIKAHLGRYVQMYDQVPENQRGGLDLLEYKLNSNHIIDRDLLGDYLSLKLQKSNIRLQKMVAVFAAASVASTIVSIILKVYFGI